MTENSMPLKLIFVLELVLVTFRNILLQMSSCSLLHMYYKCLRKISAGKSMEGIYHRPFQDLYFQCSLIIVLSQTLNKHSPSK